MRLVVTPLQTRPMLGFKKFETAVTIGVSNA